MTIRLWSFFSECMFTHQPQSSSFVEYYMEKSLLLLSKRLRMKRDSQYHMRTFSLLLKAIPIYIHNKTLIAACKTHFHMPNVNLYFEVVHCTSTSTFKLTLWLVEHIVKKNLILDRKTITNKWTFKSSHHRKFLHCQHSQKKYTHVPFFSSFNLIRGFNRRCLWIFGCEFSKTLFTRMSYWTMNINVRNKIELGAVHMRAQIK